MAYGHAERNLALIRQLEAETRQLLATVTQPDPEQSAWLLEASPGQVAPANHQSHVTPAYQRGMEGSVLPWLRSCTAARSK